MNGFQVLGSHFYNNNLPDLHLVPFKIFSTLGYFAALVLESAHPFWFLSITSPNYRQPSAIHLKTLPQRLYTL